MCVYTCILKPCTFLTSMGKSDYFAVTQIYPWYQVPGSGENRAPFIYTRYYIPSTFLQGSIDQLQRFFVPLSPQTARDCLHGT